MPHVVEGEIEDIVVVQLRVRIETDHRLADDQRHRLFGNTAVRT